METLKKIFDQLLTGIKNQFSLRGPLAGSYPMALIPVKLK